MDGTVFAFDPDWVSTLNAPFMTNAFLAGLCIALAAGVMGYFTIARHSTFAAHALAHIGLPGATGAVLLGLPVSAGLGVFALGGALVIGALGKKASQREIATGTVLAFATGLGLFFARMSSSASQQMQSILFGSILTPQPLIKGWVNCKKTYQCSPGNKRAYAFCTQLSFCCSPTDAVELGNKL